MNSASLPLAIREVDRDAPAPSCFLEGTQIQFAWDSTCLGYIKTCPRLYQYTMIEGWAPKNESYHLRFGIAFHHALENYDRLRTEGTTHQDAIRAIVGDLMVATKDWDPDPEIKEGKYKNRNTLLSLVIDYLDHYFHDVAETFILEDGRPAVELSFRFELDWGPEAGASTEGLQTIEIREVEPHVEGGISYGSQEVIQQFSVGQPYLLCGHLDRVVTYGGNLFVMDRKTTTSTPGSYYFDNFEPNNQMTLYTLASQVILGSPVKGVIIDAAQILLDKPNAFTRGITYRTPDQLEEWVQDLAVTLREAEAYAEVGYWPMRDTSCGMYGGCRFREVCSKSPHVREVFLKSKFNKLKEKDRWNPLKPR